MSDEEKTAVLVEKLFGEIAPTHMVSAPQVTCSRCGVAAHYQANRDKPCPGFDPFTRIDDAFACVEKLCASDDMQGFEVFKTTTGWCAKPGVGAPESDDVSPARAIAEAVYLAVKT